MSVYDWRREYERRFGPLPDCMPAPDECRAKPWRAGPESDPSGPARPDEAGVGLSVAAAPTATSEMMDATAGRDRHPPPAPLTPDTRHLTPDRHPDYRRRALFGLARAPRALAIQDLAHGVALAREAGASARAVRLALAAAGLGTHFVAAATGRVSRRSMPVAAVALDPAPAIRISRVSRPRGG